jgi:hypothetical protein
MSVCSAWDYYQVLGPNSVINICSYDPMLPLGALFFSFFLFTHPG